MERMKIKNGQKKKDKSNIQESQFISDSTMLSANIQHRSFLRRTV